MNKFFALLITLMVIAGLATSVAQAQEDTGTVCSIGRGVAMSNSESVIRRYSDPERTKEEGTVPEGSVLWVQPEGCVGTSVNVSDGVTSFWVDVGYATLVPEAVSEEIVNPFGTGLGCEFAPEYNGVGTYADMPLPQDAVVVFQANPSSVMSFNGSQLNMRENMLILPKGIDELPVGLPAGSVFAFVNNLNRAAAEACISSQLQFFRWASVIYVDSLDATTDPLTVTGTVIFLPGQIVSAAGSEYVQVMDAQTGDVAWTP